MFPLLLQFGLLVFAAALSVYLWKVHLSLALIVISFTSLGCVGYTSLLMSAIVSPDSPFQTPLAPLIAHFIPTTLWMKCKTFFSWATKPNCQFTKHIYSVCAPYFQPPHHVLPSFSKHRSLNSTMEQAPILFDAPFPEPSPEVPAVLWLLETSTDPHMITTAAEIAYDLQACVGVMPQQMRLYESFLACFEHLTDWIISSSSNFEREVTLFLNHV
ncbi:hypothetical protein C8R44DRAFT_327076 [Mycena epipterygia]|nr:hypothetical protein C8R44DRAFT_327076 [Mycena epipterygia]